MMVLGFKPTEAKVRTSKPGDRDKRLVDGSGLYLPNRQGGGKVMAIRRKQRCLAPQRRVQTYLSCNTQPISQGIFRIFIQRPTLERQTKTATEAVTAGDGMTDKNTVPAPPQQAP